MRRPSLRIAPLWLSLLSLTACGAADDAAVEEPMLQTEPPADDPSGALDGDTDGAVDPDSAPVAPDQPLPDELAEETPAANGLLIDGTCFAVCTPVGVDPDGDGWGWENEATCIVPESEVALRGVGCALVVEPPAPPPPPIEPPDFPTNVGRPEGNSSTGFFVRDGRLYDRLGNDFVIRGVNHPVVWYQNQALPWLEDIADTGANTVRIVWETLDYQGLPPSLDLLRQVIARTIELQMIPMVELHDATGSPATEDVLAMADYYVQDDVRDLLLEFEDYLLVNIANEWSGNDFGGAYREVIDTMRARGVNHTLVIDSNGWGQNAETIFREAPGLLEYDPQSNLLFSVHMYEEYANRPNEENGQRIRTTLERAVVEGIPLIVGEFGYQHGDDGTGNPRPIPFEVLLAQANRLGLGYIAWSWTGNSGGVEYLDLTAMQSGMLTDWGLDVVEGPSPDIPGIRNTAVPASVFLQP